MVPVALFLEFAAGKSRRVAEGGHRGAVRLAAPVRTFGLARRGVTPSGDAVVVVMGTGAGRDQSEPHLLPAEL